MPAPTRDCLYNFWEPLDAAAMDVLARADVPALVPMSGDLPAARVEAEIEVGEALDVHILPTGKTVADHFAGVLTVRIITPRTANPAAPKPNFRRRHNMLAAQVIASLSREEGEFTSAALVYHYWDTCRLTGAPRHYDDEADAYVTEINFDIEFGIRNAAWPVDNPAE